MTSVYSVETSSLAFVTPPSSPPPEFEDNFDNFSGVQTPTQRNSLSSPKQSSASPGVIANHITPPLIHRAPSSTVEITLASAVGTSSSSTSKKSPVPVQTFPTFLEPMKAGSTSEDAISVLEDSLERSLKIAQDPLTSKSISSKSKPEARIHPFAHSTAQLELLPSSTHTTAHGIDLEEEARLYAELMEGNNEDGVYEDMTEDFTRHNTPRFRTLSTPVKPSLGKLPKHKPPLPPLRNSVQNASIAGPSSASPSSSTNHHLDLAYPYKPYRSSRSSNRIKPSNTFPLPSSSRPSIPSKASYAESVFSADIYLADNTASGVGLGFNSSQSSSSSSLHHFSTDPSNPNSRSGPYTRGLAGGGLLGRGTPPPLFAQDVKIDGWLIVGEGAEPRAKTIGGALASSNSSLSSLNTQSPGNADIDSHHRTPIRLGASQVGSLRQLNTSSVGAYVVYDVVITIRAAASTFSSSTSVSNVDGIGDSTTDSGPTTTQMRVLKRYTDFELLREALVGTVGKIGGIEHHLASQIPPLPPKSAWSRFRPAFLEKRRKLLEFWLTRVLLHPEIGGREVVREWVLR